jgi:hypothetical protein
MTKHTITSAGVFRCCIATVGTADKTGTVNTDAKPGDKDKCWYCGREFKLGKDLCWRPVDGGQGNG